MSFLEVFCKFVKCTCSFLKFQFCEVFKVCVQRAQIFGHLFPSSLADDDDDEDDDHVECTKDFWRAYRYCEMIT